MAEGQREREWSLLANLMALVANCHRSSKVRAFKPADFNPTIERKKKVVGREELRAMIDKFFEGKETRF